MNPFMRRAHCRAFARRRAYATGQVFHVVRTERAEQPLQVLAQCAAFTAQAQGSGAAVLDTIDAFGADEPPS